MTQMQFSMPASKVLQLANQEAQRFNHPYLGSEHILLGLIKEGRGVAAQVFRYLQIDLRAARMAVDRTAGPGLLDVTMGQLPLSSQAQQVIERAIEEARQSGAEQVQTEHLLLGLVQTGDTVAESALQKLGPETEGIPTYITMILDGNEDPVGLDRFRESRRRLSRSPGVLLPLVLLAIAAVVTLVCYLVLLG